MKLFLFDIDGTLVRSHGVGRTALARAIEEVAGLPDPLARVKLGGMTDPLILEEAFRLAGRVLDGQAEGIFLRYIELLEVGLREARDFTVLPGVRALLERLGATEGVGLALGTGNIEAGARLKLGRAALNHHFPTGGFGSDARDRADLLLAGVKKAQALYGHPFDGVWVIGDTPRDVEAARRAGLPVAAVATGGYDYDVLAASRPDVIFEHFDDLEATVGALMSLD